VTHTESEMLSNAKHSTSVTCGDESTTWLARVRVDSSGGDTHITVRHLLPDSHRRRIGVGQKRSYKPLTFGRVGKNLEAQDRADTFVPHEYPECTVDLGEIRMNYVVDGNADSPALLLIPGQSESWWGYECAIPLLAPHFQVFAVDLRGQGRSTWTPGRYTFDNYGNDLVRFIDLVIKRPTLVAGNSSGGVLAAWLAAYAKPGQITAAYLEDPPLYSSEVSPICGPGIRQTMVGAILASRVKWLGDQWSVGDWPGWVKALPDELPEQLQAYVGDILGFLAVGEGQSEPPQHLREYDPELARSFVEGRFFTGSDSERLLSSVRVPVLLSHHSRNVDPDTGFLFGALADIQAQRARHLVEAAGQRFTYKDFPAAAHGMHDADPELYARTVIDWGITKSGEV
jgi:pimeloyl-ACP methyl ester carboxylesterase